MYICDINKLYRDTRFELPLLTKTPQHDIIAAYFSLLSAEWI